MNARDETGNEGGGGADAGKVSLRATSACNLTNSALESAWWDLIDLTRGQAGASRSDGNSKNDSGGGLHFDCMGIY